jgi:hypothetical protein
MRGGAPFVLANKRDAHQVLWVERNGFYLLYERRLHQAVFELPAARAGSAALHIEDSALTKATRRGSGSASESVFKSFRNTHPGSRVRSRINCTVCNARRGRRMQASLSRARRSRRCNTVGLCG